MSNSEEYSSLLEAENEKLRQQLTKAEQEVDKLQNLVDVWLPPMNEGQIGDTYSYWMSCHQGIRIFSEKSGNGFIQSVNHNDTWYHDEVTIYPTKEEAMIAAQKKLIKIKEHEKI